MLAPLHEEHWPRTFWKPLHPLVPEFLSQGLGAPSVVWNPSPDMRTSLGRVRDFWFPAPPVSLCPWIRILALGTFSPSYGGCANLPRPHVPKAALGWAETPARALPRPLLPSSYEPVWMMLTWASRKTLRGGTEAGSPLSSTTARSEKAHTSFKVIEQRTERILQLMENLHHKMNNMWDAFLLLKRSCACTYIIHG